MCPLSSAVTPGTSSTSTRRSSPHAPHHATTWAVATLVQDLEAQGEAARRKRDESQRESRQRDWTDGRVIRAMPMPMIVCIDDARDVERGGRKAAMLARLRRSRLRRADGFRIPVATSGRAAAASWRAGVARGERRGAGRSAPRRIRRIARAGSTTTHLGVRSVDGPRGDRILPASSGGPRRWRSLEHGARGSGGVAVLGQPAHRRPRRGPHPAQRVVSVRRSSAEAVDGDDCRSGKGGASCEANLREHIDEADPLSRRRAGARWRPVCEGRRTSNGPSSPASATALARARPINPRFRSPHASGRRRHGQKDVARFGAGIRRTVPAQTNLRTRASATRCSRRGAHARPSSPARSATSSTVHAEPDGGGRPATTAVVAGSARWPGSPSEEAPARARRSSKDGSASPQRGETEAATALQRRLLQDWAELDLGAPRRCASRRALETLRREVHEE